MPKFMMVLALGFLSSTAMAADVKITSYVYINSERKVAELCGVVTNSETPTNFVQITVDHKSKRPAIYNVMSGPSGKFCTVVISHHATAIAEVL